MSSNSSLIGSNELSTTIGGGGIYLFERDRSRKYLLLTLLITNKLILFHQVNGKEVDNCKDNP
jgi:hypothetical protein